MPVVAQCFEIVRSDSASRKEDLAISFRSACFDAEPRWTWMRRKFAPFELVRILTIDLGCPAFFRSGIGRAARWIFHGAVNVDDRVVGERARVAEDGGSRNWRGLAP